MSGTSTCTSPLRVSNFKRGSVYNALCCLVAKELKTVDEAELTKEVRPAAGSQEPQPKDAVPSSEALRAAAGKLLEKVKAAKAARAKAQAASQRSEPLPEAERTAEGAPKAPAQEPSPSSERVSTGDAPKKAQEAEKEEDPVEAAAVRWKTWSDSNGISR